MDGERKGRILRCDFSPGKLSRPAADPLEKVSRVRHLPLFERAPAVYVSGANFLSSS